TTTLPANMVPCPITISSFSARGAVVSPGSRKDRNRLAGNCLHPSFDTCADRYFALKMRHQARSFIEVDEADAVGHQRAIGLARRSVDHCGGEDAAIAARGHLFDGGAAAAWTQRAWQHPVAAAAIAALICNRLSAHTVASSTIETCEESTPPSP